MGGGKKDPQVDMDNGNRGVLLVESIAELAVLKATDTSLTAPTAVQKWTERGERHESITTNSRNG